MFIAKLQVWFLNEHDIEEKITIWMRKSCVLILRTIKFNWLHILHTIRNSNKSYVKNIQWFLPIPFSTCQVRVSWLLDSQNAAFNDTRAPFNLFDIAAEFERGLKVTQDNLLLLDFRQGPSQLIVQWPWLGLQSPDKNSDKAEGRGDKIISVSDLTPWQRGHFAMKNKGGTLPCCHVPSPSSWAMTDCHHPSNNESSLVK